MKHVFLFGIFGWFLSFTLVAQTGIWQWSVPVRNFSTHPKNPESRAYLWIPSQCEQVKAILVAQHNMEEISILEDEVFRQRMAELDVAQIWVCPSFNHGFDFTDRPLIEFSQVFRQSVRSFSLFLSRIPHLPPSIFLARMKQERLL